MVMTSVAAATIIHDSVTKIRDFLQNNLTDPSSRTDPPGWVFTSYPERDVDYPIVTVMHNGSRDAHVSLGTEYKQLFITLRIEVWSKSTKQKDEIWDDIYDELRHHYTSVDANGDSITGLGLFDAVVTSCVDFHAEAPKGAGHIHRKIADIQFSYYATS